MEENHNREVVDEKQNNPPQQSSAFIVNHHSTPPPVHIINNVSVNAAPPPVTETVVFETEPSGLPCGIGVGWCLFILGWFIGIPWYVGAIILLFSKVDPRERPGYIACTIFAIVLTVAAIIIATKGKK